MTKFRIYALLLAGGIALSLAGCAGQHALTEETGRAEINSQISQTAEPEKEASAIEADGLLPAEDGSAPAESETETPAAEPAEKEQKPETPSAPAQTGQPQAPKQQTPEPSETAPVQGQTPASQPTAQTEPAQAERGAESPAPEPSVPETPAFDVGYWVSFAKGYAQSIGLELDSEATGCWDNPTAASAKSIYLKRDLCGMLDKYNRDPDITAVWIWAEQRTETSWDIYIGYA